MPRERPLVEIISPDKTSKRVLRGIISPCAGCKNNIPVVTTPEEADGLADTDRPAGIPCPKQVLYARKRFSEDVGGASLTANYGGGENPGSPIFDESLRGTNPVWPGLKKYGNAYSYAFVATYEDNVDNGYNPTFDTEKIHCRGPFLIKTPERKLNFAGHLEQGDPILAMLNTYRIDGADFHGFIEEAMIWQVARGYMREIDRITVKSVSANGSL